MRQLSGAEIALIRHRNGLNNGFFLYARKEMRLNSAFTARNTRLYRLLRRVEVRIALHTPPTFTDCFSARCCPNQPRCVQNRSFSPSLRPSAPPFAHMIAFFSLEIPAIFARCSPDEVGTQSLFRPEPWHSGTWLCLGSPGSAAVVCGCTCFCRCILQASPLDRLSAVKSLPAMSRRRAVGLARHARLPWSAFLLRRGKVRAPKGVSNPCDRILNDRAALSREFPRN